MRDPVNPRAQRAARVEDFEAPPHGEMNFLQQIAASLRVALVTERHPRERGAEFREHIPKPLVVCHDGRSTSRASGVNGLEIKRGCHERNSPRAVPFLTAPTDISRSRTGESKPSHLSNGCDGAILTGIRQPAARGFDTAVLASSNAAKSGVMTGKRAPECAHSPPSRPSRQSVADSPERRGTFGRSK